MATREREKALKRRENKDNRARAVGRYIRISPSKVRIVIDLIRGKKVDEARAILMNTPNGACEPVLKVLTSAIANAENNLELNRDSLIVAEAFADQGPTLKRFQPRSQGRAYKILKRSSHITVILGEAKEEK